MYYGNLDAGKEFHCSTDSVLGRTDVRLHRLAVGVSEGVLHVEAVDTETLEAVFDRAANAVRRAGPARVRRGDTTC